VPRLLLWSEKVVRNSMREPPLKKRETRNRSNRALGNMRQPIVAGTAPLRGSQVDLGGTLDWRGSAIWACVECMERGRKVAPNYK
jgi:hypothetical protein